MTFTKEQMYEIFNAITGTDTKFIQGLAKAAITTALEIQTDMFLDADPTCRAPNEGDIRRQAYGFTVVRANGFRAALLKEINDVAFNAHIRTVRVMKSKLEFND